MKIQEPWPTVVYGFIFYSSRKYVLHFRSSKIPPLRRKKHVVRFTEVFPSENESADWTGPQMRKVYGPYFLDGKSKLRLCRTQCSDDERT